MKVKIDNATGEWEMTAEINTLEELMELYKKIPKCKESWWDEKEGWIIWANDDGTIDKITLYDFYVE